jgi:hypothetical protein
LLLCLNGNTGRMRPQSDLYSATCGVWSRAVVAKRNFAS